MNEEKLLSLTKWFHEYAQSFKDHQPDLPFAIRLKLNHSLRVAHDMEQIATELGWPTEDVRTAKALGLLHDVARFSQFAEYGTFHDPRSINHGERGWQICLEMKLLADCSTEDQQRILEGVRYHNRREIPPEAHPDALRFIKLIRDADKLDIFKIVDTAIEKNQFRDNPEILLHVEIDGPPNPVVLDELEQTRSASYKNLKTLADFMLVQLFWVYDLNYAPAIRRYHERQTLDHIAKRLPDTDRIRKIIQEARSYVETHEK
jgi:putative nucleotidyltransferase with HDIG domain